MHSSYPSQHINKSTCCLIMSLWGIIHDLKLLKLMHSKGLKQIRASSKGGASTFRSCLITLFCNISTQQWKSAVVTVSSPANPLAAAVDCFSFFRRNPFGLSAQCSWQVHALLESDPQSSFFSSLSGRGPDLVWIQSPPHISHIFSTLLISVFTAVKMASFLFYCCTFPSIGSNPFVILHSDHEYIVQMQPFSHAL